MKKTGLLILFFSVYFSFTTLANSFPEYTGVVQVEGQDAEQIYKTLKASISKLQLADVKEISDDAENKQFIVSGYTPFYYTAMMVRIDGRIVMNVDFKVRDERFKYIITVTDVYVENDGGMKQSAYNDLLNNPKKKISKIIFPHVEKAVQSLTERISNIATVKKDEDNDDW